MSTLSEQLKQFLRSHPPRQAESRGVLWPYFTGGERGETILLLHGGGGNGAVFFAYFPPLETGFRLLAPSLPDDVTTIDDAIAGIVALLDRERIDAVHVFGHSQGGYLALALAHRHPDRLRTLSIACTGLPSARQARIVNGYLRWLDWTPNFVLPSMMQFALLHAARRGGNALTADERRVLSRFVPLDDRTRLRRWARNSALLQLDYHHHERTDRRWQGPVLAIETGRDHLIATPEAGRLRAHYPQAVVFSRADAGHLDPIIRTGEFIHAFRLFLGGNTPVR